MASFLLGNTVDTGGTIRILNPPLVDLDMSEYSFSKFATMYFNAMTTNSHSKRPLKKSLLSHSLPMDEISAQAIWIMILRFMGDMAEVNYPDDDGEIEIVTRSSIMQRLTTNMAKSHIQSKEFQEPLTPLGLADHQRLIHRTLKRKTKLPDILRRALDNSDEIEYYHQTLGTNSSSLDKLHFIIGHAILRPELRDEILCQICKQLTNNPNQASYAKGWILLSLCISCFPPSPSFEKYLRSFIRSGPDLYGNYFEQCLDRTLKNGSRTQPPSWLELQASRDKTPIKLNVFLMDGTVKKLQIDSASTAKEAVEQLTDNIGLIDNFGFAIVIALYDKIMSLGCGREHIMDAISSCEQYAKEQGENEQRAPWKLYLRKEVFTPWYNPSLDQLATHLIYKQVTRGVNFGEYRCKTENDIAMLCALQYYAEHGSKMDPEILSNVIPHYVPKDLLASGERAVKNWTQFIVDAFNRSNYHKDNIPPASAKEDISIYAHLTWPMMFSRFFEAVRVTGPKLLSDNVVIAVNSLGVFLIDETEQVLAEFSYPEILSVLSEADTDSHVNELRINTVQRENFSFKCFESRDVSELINYLLNGLKQRSRHGVAIQDYAPADEGDEDRLTLVKGDLVVFEKGITGAMVMDSKNRWSRGDCNGENGTLPTEAIFVLATLDKPSSSVLKIFKESYSMCIECDGFNCRTIPRKKLHTLEKFAEEHFRQNISKDLRTQIVCPSTPIENELWRHCRHPNKVPLLKKTFTDPELTEKALTIFSEILKYMGDIPRGKLPVNTDLIFEPALENEHIRDELFCQLMKQLTCNRVLHSEERGWDLMWLSTGVIYPSSNVMKELNEFLRTRTHPLAIESLRRVRKTLSCGQRRHPPYIIETEAIRNRCMQINHKIYFPDNTVDAFEIQSHTRGLELCDTIAQRLDLKFCQGFSLFVKISDKVFSIPENEYIFDFISDLALWMKQSMPRRSNEQQSRCQYQLFFMKKLWIETTPGVDVNADRIFYYSQEVPKYLNGYYKISKELGAYLAAIVYRIQFGNNMVPLQRIHDVLPKLLPDDVIPLQKSHEWKTGILRNLTEIGPLNEAAGKDLFLKKIFEFPMFGSTFFMVQQKNDQKLPETILVAINRYGFFIIDPRTKDVLRKYNYSELNLWSSGNTFFHVRFGNMIGASKLLCSTTQGYKMDDLLSSYLQYFNEHKDL